MQSVLDTCHARRIAKFQARAEACAGERPATGDIGDTARAVSLGRGADGGSYGAVDETGGRALRMGAQALVGRKEDIPGGAPLAAIPRHAL